MKVSMLDLRAQKVRLGGAIENAIARVVEHGAFVMGPEVYDLEMRLAQFAGVTEVVTCANGTDAIVLALRALGVGPGTAVYVPAFTFAATAEAVALCGATPVFVDVLPDTFNMDPASLWRALDREIPDLPSRAIVTVDLFGQPADYNTIGRIAGERGIPLVADAAQSFGASLGGKKVGGLALLTTTSFFPAKPLGCYGDGGAVMTDDTELARRLRSLRLHGRGTDKYDNVRVGMNSRLDTIQAAVLIEKLQVFVEEIAARNRLARRYSETLREAVTVPMVGEGAGSTWAQYTVRSTNRDRLAEHLKEAGVSSAIYYSTPLHQLRAYDSFPVSPDGLKTAEYLSDEVISLPLHPYLEVAEQDFVISRLLECLS